MKKAAPVILIVSENRIFRESLAGFFATEPDLRIGGVSGSEDLFARLPAVAPDVVLLDMDSLGPVPESLLHDLRRSHPEIPILAMGMLDAEHAVARLLRGGVVGFVGKREPLETLRRALTVVARGETWAPRRATARALAGLAQERRVETVTLTPRERELLSLLSGGYRNRELAAMLQIKEQTVKMHLHRLFQKLRVKSRVAAVLHANELQAAFREGGSPAVSAVGGRTARRRSRS